MSGPSRQSPTFVCHRARHPSQAPDTSFPSTHLLSPLARRIRTAEDIASSGLRGFWRRRRRQRQLLRDCSVLLERSAGRPEGPLSSRRGDGYGWQFVRLRYDGDASLGVGWSVYEVWLSEA